MDNQINETVGQDTKIVAANESRFSAAHYSEPLTAFTAGWKDNDELAKLLAFLETLVSASLPFKETIYAWEVMNEPSWNTRIFAPGLAGEDQAFRYWPTPPLVSKDAMRRFLAEGVARIEALGFPSTVGHALLEDLAEFPTGSVPQFHYYSALDSPLGALRAALGDKGQDLPTLGDVKERLARDPASPDPFVGEIGSSVVHGVPWPALDGRDAGPDLTEAVRRRVFERLQHVAGMGYGLSLVWPDLGWKQADEEVRRLRHAKRDEARRLGLPEPDLGPEPDPDEDPLKLSTYAIEGILDFTRRGGDRPGVPVA